jgi:hypothetical protein
MDAAAKNLEAIGMAIVQHNGNCQEPLTEIRMNPFEVERLGWDEFRGVPIAADEEIGTGRFRLVCSGASPCWPSPAIGQHVSMRDQVPA